MSLSVFHISKNDYINGNLSIRLAEVITRNEKVALKAQSDSQWSELTIYY